MNTPTKEQIVSLLDAWIRQRPGLEFGNYGDVSAYRSEVRSIGRDLQDARQLLRAVELSGITGEELAAAFPRAFSGRLVLQYRAGKVMQWVNVSDLPDGYPFADDSQFRLDYCTVQYWPTEYRRAACAVLASALWDYKREKCMPAPDYIVECLYEDNHGIGEEYIRANVGTYAARSDAEHYAATLPAARSPRIAEEYDGISGGEWLRRSFRREYGRRIASRWFD